MRRPYRTASDLWRAPAWSRRGRPHPPRSRPFRRRRPGTFLSPPARPELVDLLPEGFDLPGAIAGVWHRAALLSLPGALLAVCSVHCMLALVYTLHTTTRCRGGLPRRGDPRPSRPKNTLPHRLPLRLKPEAHRGTARAPTHGQPRKALLPGRNHTSFSYVCQTAYIQGLLPGVESKQTVGSARSAGTRRMDLRGPPGRNGPAQAAAP
jgi:hypothetical protein